MNKIITELECPLCHSPVEIGVRERGYSGHVEEEDKIPKDGKVCFARRYANGKMRYTFWLKGYIPMCSNKGCFLHGLTKQFKSIEYAKEAWTEKARIW